MRLLLSILLALVLFGTCSQAADVTVVTEQWPPFNYSNDKGELTGLSTDILRLALSQSGLEPDFQILPWARAYDMAQNDSGVFIFSILRSPAREPHFQWVGPLIPSLSVNLYKLKRRTNINISSLEEAKQYTIAVMKNGSTQLFLQGQGFLAGENLEVAASNDLGIKKLFWERVDLISGNAPAMAQLARANGFNFSELEEVLPLYDCGLYAATSLQTPQSLINRMQTGLDSIPPEHIETLIQSYLQ
ncbi:substrate-binding periplasmic protein [Desulfovibrio ferrophilus]|uniref:Extracellular solute-binding protein family 3 n=1 Tax=Desulfovibrio ferrophilus TaxID=241368 RepID=A0A2Z6AV96_9BACT|nr:transporter substrate-binding domain-containing protein [Desulfovibrio ferrophilus]BBD07162.1 extracellular solute-binding protein family 3 [Desulfovibrio ferrophilus]